MDRQGVTKPRTATLRSSHVRTHRRRTPHHVHQCNHQILRHNLILEPSTPTMMSASNGHAPLSMAHRGTLRGPADKDPLDPAKQQLTPMRSRRASTEWTLGGGLDGETLMAVMCLSPQAVHLASWSRCALVVDRGTGRVNAFTIEHKRKRRGQRGKGKAKSEKGRGKARPSTYFTQHLCYEREYRWLDSLIPEILDSWITPSPLLQLPHTFLTASILD